MENRHYGILLLEVNRWRMSRIKSSGMTTAGRTRSTAYSRNHIPTHSEALAAARTAAAEQRVPGHTEVIEYEDENGRWHTETASGRDRPETDVQDTI
jgi:hypothetical protein